MSAIGTLRYAKEFFAAAEVLQPRPTNALSQFRSDHEISIPVYYLICHSIELALKAALYNAGYSESQLAGKDKSRGVFGHNLLALYDAALNGDLAGRFSPTKDDRMLVALIAPYFVKKQIEYFYRGFSTYPKHSLLSDLARRLLHSVEHTITK